MNPQLLHTASPTSVGLTLCGQPMQTPRWTSEDADNIRPCDACREQLRADRASTPAPEGE